MIRLKDIAERAGVSLMTVSKVLRDAPDVSKETKARIRALAQQMGYVPDALARGLRTRQTKLFGLVLPSLTHPVMASAASAVQDHAQELGYDVLISQTHDELQHEEVCLRRLLARRVDGLLVAPVYRLSPHAAVYDELFASHTPTVLLGHGASFCSRFPSVALDDIEASYRMTQHLVSLGHRQIAFFAGPPAAPWAQEQLEGYRRALREAQIPFQDGLIFTAGPRFEDGQRAAEQMLEERTVATAIQTVGDGAAVGAANYLASRGIVIPKDISVTGFGDYQVAQHFPVPLTTVRLPKHDMGSAAVELMLRLLRGEPCESKRLAPEMIVRSSTTGAPRTVQRPRAGQDPSEALTDGDEMQ